MLLSKYFENVISDNTFDFLGLIDSKTDYSMLTFVDNIKYLDNLLANDTITCVVTNENIAKILLSKRKIGIAVSKTPKLDFFKLHNMLASLPEYKGNTFVTMIEDNCQISELSHVSKRNVIIGKNTIVEEFVSIKENTIIGDNCIIRAGSVIGSSGFEFKRTDDGILSIMHVGKVEIGNNVEIKCNTVVDKAIYPWDSTKIGDFSKIDNLVHIAHAVKIENNVMIPAMSVIAGRTQVKEGSWIGIGSVIRNGLIIGKNARVNMGSVVTRNVNEDESVSGNWAIEHSKFIDLIKERDKHKNI